MEVHTHPHTERKKWTHYLWEFLMLFLAVFCGFLAENQREHMIEHQREKQYMSSFLDDLKQDTVAIKKSIKRSETNLLYTDSVLLFLHNKPLENEIPIHFAYLDSQALIRLQIIFTDRTASQLKNSGGMRIIRNQKVVDLILRYWNQQEITKTTLERYLIYRNHGREFGEQLYKSSEFYLYNRNLLKDAPEKTGVIKKDPALWAEFANIIAHSGIVLPAHIGNLKTQLELADELEKMIKKEYHLK